MDDLTKQVAEMTPRPPCSACSRTPARLRRCGGSCGGAAKYCDEACAKADWPRHKRECGKTARKPSQECAAERELLHAACDAVRAGDAAALERLLARGLNVALKTGRSYADWPHCSLLHMCCAYSSRVQVGRLACLRLLLAAPGVDVNACYGDPCALPGMENTQETPLILAMRYFPPAVEPLLEHGALPDLADWFGNTPLSVVDEPSSASPQEKAAMRAALEAALASRRSGAAAQQAEALREAEAALSDVLDNDSCSCQHNEPANCPRCEAECVVTSESVEQSCECVLTDDDTATLIQSAYESRMDADRDDARLQAVI
jgi:hypothetical protein